VSEEEGVLRSSNFVGRTMGRVLKDQHGRRELCKKLESEKHSENQ